MKILIKTLCGFLICLLVAFSVANVYRYKAEQCFDRGRRLLAKKEHDAGLLPIAQAVKYNPFCLIYRDILSVLTLKLAIEHKDLDLLGLSIKSAGLVTEMYPDHYYSYYTMAQGYHRIGQKDKAIEYYKKAMTRHPHLPVIRKKLETLL